MPIVNLPIFDWRLAIKPIGNRESKIENRKQETHPLPRGGTNFMSLRRVRLRGGLPHFLAMQEG
ncbi:MAG TPA: hypothetical protein DC047_15930 [Blastocatellia bacterium]|nr:hypothetical protein [Blastocatellia bacterium]